jgi:hypothetical protein
MGRQNSIWHDANLPLLLSAMIVGMSATLGQSFLVRRKSQLPLSRARQFVLFREKRLALLNTLRELAPARDVIESVRSAKEFAMPILLWVAFWSSMTGIAKGWQETMLPIRVNQADRRDRPAE